MNKHVIGALAAVLLCVALAGCDATPTDATNNLRANVLGIATALPTAEAVETAQVEQIQKPKAPQSIGAGTVADAFDIEDALHGDARRGAAMASLMALAGIAGMFGLGFAVSKRAHRSRA